MTNDKFDLEKRLSHLKNDGSILSGMTVNERLFHLGLMDEFDAAVLRRDKQSLLEIYQKMEIDESGALLSIETIFANPSRYGYK